MVLPNQRKRVWRSARLLHEALQDLLHLSHLPKRAKGLVSTVAGGAIRTPAGPDVPGARHVPSHRVRAAFWNRSCWFENTRRRGRIVPLRTYFQLP